MSYLVIARKWRPKSFEDIAGQEHITRTLQNAIRAHRIAHAYLFTGVRGVGKTTAARVLAKALNCEKGPTATPCNQCTQCEEITQGNSIDVLEIDGASNRGIDEIRQIIENVRYQPAKSRFKIYIIDEVHQVTKDAFNALLKTLEEPPASVKFILATTEPHRLPDTILSRCQRYDFRRIRLREIVERLASIGQSEGLKLTDGALVLLAREADGSMRDAQSLLEQVLAFAEPGDGKGTVPLVDESLLQEILGLAARRVLYEISAAVLRGDAQRCVELVAEVVNQGRDPGRLSRDLVEHFRNLLVARLISGHTQSTSGKDSSAAGSARLLDLPDQEIADLSEQARDVSVETLLDYFDFMAAGDEETARSAMPRFALETVLIRLASLPQSLPVADLITRLERLEGKPAAVIHSTGPSARAQETIAPSPRLPPAPVQSNLSVPAGTTDAWREFVAFVSKEQKFLASHLASSTVLTLPPENLKITVSERQHLAFLQDSDNFMTLKELATRFFAQDVTIQIAGVVADSALKPSEMNPQPSMNSSEDRSPMVKEALRIFGGSIRNVRRDNG